MEWRRAIDEVIRICKGRKVLDEYLSEHEKEVVNIMGTLFDAEEISRIHDISVRQKGRIQQYIEDCQEFNRSKDEVAASITVNSAIFFDRFL